MAKYTVRARDLVAGSKWCYIDGTPCKRDEWLGRMKAARYDEAANTRAIFEEQGIAEGNDYV